MYFPKKITPNKDGIVAVGGALGTEILLEAYSKGIFPWPHEGYPLLWFFPLERGVLFFDKFHVSKSLKKFLNKCHWSVTWDKSFELVIKNCSSVPRASQTGTWISEDILSSYIELHKRGFAHSVEVWDGEELIGGAYGVFVQNVFSAESMFFKKSNASKVALYYLVDRLKKMGLEWMDVQMVTPISEQFGAEYVSYEDYRALLKSSQKS